MSQTCALCGGDATHAFLSDLRDREYGTPWTGTVKRCASCGLAQQAPMLTTDEALALYPANYQQYVPSKTSFAALLMKTYMRRTVRLMRALGVRPGQAILDIGCAGGEKLAILTSALRCQGVGVEPNAIAAETARRRFGLEVHTGTFPHPDLSERRFDVIYINHVIEHVPDPVALLSSIRRALKPGGIVVGETENIGSLSARLFRQYWALLHLPFHLFFFTEPTLRLAFEKAGFENPSIRTQTDAPSWSLSIQNFIRRNAKPGQTERARVPGYIPLTLAFVPISWIEAGQGPLFTFWCRKPLSGAPPAS